jgi:hypothetical protein
VEAGSLLGRNPDVIVTMGTPGLNAVRHHTKSIPVVFTLVADPARLGLIESLARPGGLVALMAIGEAEVVFARLFRRLSLSSGNSSESQSR